jgi:hypothetical protein
MTVRKGSVNDEFPVLIEGGVRAMRRPSPLAVCPIRILLLDPGATRARIGPTQTTTSDGVFGGG